MTSWLIALRARILWLLNPPRPHRCPCTTCRARRGRTVHGTCWVDGRKTLVEARLTLLPGLRVATCADRQGCDMHHRAKRRP